VTTNWHIPFKNTLDPYAVVLFACEIRQLFFIVFYVVRAVHTCGFRLDINDKHCVIQRQKIVFLTVSVVFTHPSLRVLRVSTHATSLE
jgi:hypothetical protein